MVHMKYENLFQHGYNIITEEDELKWNTFCDAYKEVDYTKMVEKTDGTKHSQEAACAGGKCELV